MELGNIGPVISGKPPSPGLKPIDFALVALGDPGESCCASQALGELGNIVRAMVLPTRGPPGAR
ncbi:hypothetical protein FOA52_015365 [Chlamydomonas sp. UWO 241]|nr:hypothetical protein FOA52_015365 [Chlamydomonas sp. UWO 241]